MRLSRLVIALVAGFALLPASAGATAFSDPVNFGVGADPESVAIGDFNGDGDADLAIANRESDNASILLGGPGGGFTGAAGVSAGEAPESVAIGDFNGDSDPDLAFANRGTESVSILLGSTDGGFTGPTNFGAGEAPAEVAVGDFDGDSDADLAVANAFSDDVSILLGDDGGNFGAPVAFGAGSKPEGLAVGDLDGNSDPDLVVANASSDDVSILLGLAGGAFAPATTFAVGNSPRSVAIANFDADSDRDLAVANAVSANVSILAGNGDGTFGAAVNLGLGANRFPLSIATGELNGDSDPDLVTANSDPDDVSILLGGAGGSFAPPTNFGAANGPSAVAIGEFNGDGRPDLAVTNSASDNVSILYGQVVPTIATEATAVAQAGQQISDQAVLAGGDSPTGSITFSAYGPDNATCTGTPVFTDTVTVTGNGTYASAAFVPPGVGTYRWIASYSGDLDNSDVSGACNDPSEASVVGPTSPALAAAAASPNVPIGGQVSDIATLVGGFNPTGTITFSLYGPDNATCTGTPAFTDTVTVSGSGTYESGDFTPTVAGVYRWVTAYSGDANNAPLARGCHLPEQGVVVTQVTPALANDASADVVIGGQLGDTATLSGAHSPSGEIVFRLYGPGDAGCAGAPVFTETVAVAGNGAHESAGFTPTATGEYRWVASYSGDANNAPAASACGEAAAHVRVDKSPTGTALASSRNPALTGETVTFEATVSGYQPSGTVTFRQGSTVLGTSPLDAAGKASFSTAALSAHSHQIVAAYSGDENNHASTSQPLSQIVENPPARHEPPAPPSPNVRLIYHPNRPHAPNPAGGPRYTFRFVDAAPGVTFYCRLDKRPFAPCTSPKVYRNLKRGRHVFQVKSVDAAGTESPVQTIRFRAGVRR